MKDKFEITLNDLPYDMKEMVEYGIYTEEEALEEYKRSLKMCRHVSDIKDVYYIVGIKNDCRHNLKLTTINKEFCGKFIHQSHGNLYFELNGSRALVIVPEEWVSYCAPSKAL